MDTTAILLTVAGVLAVGDWVAVALHRRRVEYALKPAALAALVAAAATADLPGDVQPWVVGAVALGLLGDVGVMLANDDATDRWFLGGLFAFLLGHAAYVVAFLQFGVRGWESLGGALVAVGLGALTLPAVLRGARRTGGLELALVVSAYSLLVAVMATGAAGTTSAYTAGGGALFLVSDALLARERFVAPFRFSPVLVAVTYHAAQFLILIGLVGVSNLGF